MSCAGPGTAWAPGQYAKGAPSPSGCDYTYTRSTVGYPNDELTATYSIEWTVSWTGSGGAAGTLPAFTTSTTAVFAVAEAQAVVE